MKKADVLLAGAISAWMLVEVWVEHLRPTRVTAPLMLVAGLSLAWRRSYPIVIALLFVTTMIAQAAAGMTLHSAVAPFVAMLVVSWSIGAYEERRRAVFGLALFICGLWTAMGVDLLRGTDHYVGTDFPWIAAILLLPGVLGVLFGSRTRSLRAAEARAVQLEVERREAVAAERA